MANITLGWPNRIDAATVSGGSWQATLPLSNIKDRRLSRLARSSNALAASTIINLDLGSARTVGAVALVAHNLSVSATVRIMGDDAADFATPVYSSGWFSAWASGVIPQELLEWEDDNFWLGTISQQAAAGYQSPIIHIVAARPVLRYWRIEISDTSNSDGYVQIGRVFIGDTWTSTYNYSYGTGLGHEDSTEIESSLGGEEYFDDRKRFRVFRFALDWLTESESYVRVIDLQRLAGVSGELLVVPDSDDATHSFRRSFLGRLRSLSPMIHVNSAQRSAQFEIKEVF